MTTTLSNESNRTCYIKEKEFEAFSAPYMGISKWNYYGKLKSVSS